MNQPTRWALALAALLSATAGGLGACNSLIGIDSGHARPTPTQIAAGSDFACALLTDGTVWCWGGNDYLQLGHLPIASDQVCENKPDDAATLSYVCNPKPTQVKITAVTQIALGDYFACALNDSGEVSCWGRNDNAQIGGTEAGSFFPKCPNSFFDGGSAGSEPCSALPQQVQHLPKATSIVAGAAHACAVTSDGVYCWGANQSGQLGATTGEASSGGPVLAKGVGAIEKLAAPLGPDNMGFTCGISGGVPECWGHDQANYTMEPMNCTTEVPCRIPVSGALGVVTGPNFACAVGEEASLTCWGFNAFDAFAIPPPPGHTTPVTSEYRGYLESADTGTAVLDTRYSHVLVADERGGLWGWGDNTMGELGAADSASMSACPPGGPTLSTCIVYPIQINLGDGGLGEAGPVKLIAAGQEFSLAVTSDGTVWAWGSNSEGQLGRVSSPATPCPNAYPDSPPCDRVPSAVLIPVP
jgi:alpha-tubulin suppressor-like RCC1 family protein